MYKTKLCLGTSSRFGISTEEQIRLFAKTGFEAVFTSWTPGCDMAYWKKIADSEGVIYHFVHAPFEKAHEMWEDGEVAEIAVNELKECIKDTADSGIDMVVCHVFKGFKDHCPNETGIRNYERVVDYAKELGIKVAFENTEGEEYLEAIMNAFKNKENVGFCWDTGHEMCYNKSKDMLALYGDRLMCTHINDNLGIRNFDGNITYLDDLHLLPFDGIGDWEDIVTRLNKYAPDGILTFELNKTSKRDRHENDLYEKMSIEDYITQAYISACRVATLKQKMKNK